MKLDTINGMRARHIKRGTIITIFKVNKNEVSYMLRGKLYKTTKKDLGSFELLIPISEYTPTT